MPEWTLGFPDLLMSLELLHGSSVYVPHMSLAFSSSNSPKMCIIVKSRLSVIPIDVIVRESTSFAVYLGEEGPAMPQGLLTN